MSNVEMAGDYDDENNHVASDMNRNIAEKTVNGLSNLKKEALRSTTSISGLRLSEAINAVTSKDNDDLSDDSIENYDKLELDPDTLVANSRKSLDATFRPSGAASATSLLDGSAENDSKPGRPRTRNRNSIQITLEKTDRKGRYILRADDPEIREILQRGIKREEDERSDKKPSRMRFRDLVFTRQFTTFDRQNPATSQSPFFGFFTLFWLAMGLLLCQVALRNWRDYGSVLGRNQLMKMMFSRDVMVLGLTDGVMCLACFEGYILQKLVQKGYIDWSSSGWVIQNVWQSFYLAALVGWTYFRDWPWTHTVFAVLHGLVFVMKQHSYCFYNGHLSTVVKRRELLKHKLAQLEVTSPVATPISPTNPFDNIANTSGAEVDDLAKKVLQRRSSIIETRSPANSQNGKADVASVALAIQAGDALTHDQMKVFEDVVRTEIDDLTRELQGKSSDSGKAYPKNLTVFSLAEFICLPTLVYELEYPRQDKINWWYVLEKTIATFGILFIMMVISQGFIYPAVIKTIEMKEAGMTIDERWREFPFIVSDMLFPLLIEQLLTWYLIWECILNLIAELTYFADRGFYGDWWNSVTFDQYARDWNRPVHNFLLRHVYHSSISTFHLSRNAATFVTFLLSALVHEMVMAVMFKKVRGYLFWMQLLQLPLVAFSRNKLMRDKVVLGNTLFWLGLFVGPSFLTSLYLII